MNLFYIGWYHIAYIATNSKCHHLFTFPVTINRSGTHPEWLEIVIIYRVFGRMLRNSTSEVLHFSLWFGDTFHTVSNCYIAESNMNAIAKLCHKLFLICIYSQSTQLFCLQICFVFKNSQSCCTASDKAVTCMHGVAMLPHFGISIMS